MTTNPYINLTNINYFTSPYADGFANLSTAFSSSANDRFSHFTAGVALLIPVANVVVYLALKHFATLSAPPAGSSDSSKESHRSRRHKRHHSHHRSSSRSHHSSSSSSRTKTRSSSPRPIRVTSHSSGSSSHPSFHGAGILPYRFNNGQLEFLIGKESGGVHPNTWSDFGGKPERGESPIQAAAREGAEETGKILGSKSTLERRLKKAPKIGSKYVMYLLPMNDPKVTTDAFRRARTDGEKSTIAWVRADEVFRASQGNGALAIGNRVERLRPPFIGTLQFKGSRNTPSAAQVFAQIRGESLRERRSA